MSETRTTYVPARGGGDLSMNEQALLGQTVSAAGNMISHRQMSHLARSEDTAVTNAQASLLYSAAYAIPAAMITGGILLMAFLILGGDLGLYALFWLVIWGICILVALIFNRWQGLWFSPAGLDHHEIESRERIAFHAIDKHVGLIEKRWQNRD